MLGVKEMSDKILIVAPSWLGDIIMSQSLLKTLKAQDPNCEITMYAPAYSHPIIERMPEVNHILKNPFDHGELNLSERRAEGKRLKAEGFTKAYILPNSIKSALVPFFAGINERIGLKGESRYILLNKMRKDKALFPRMVERYVSLAYVDDKSVKDKASLPSFNYPSLETKEPSSELLERLNLSLDRPLMCLGCGANYGPSKLWPVEYFAKVSANFIENGGSVLGLGTKGDSKTVQAIFEALKPLVSSDKLQYFYDVAGKTNLTEALDLVGVCKIAVCNDSGLMHTVAAANVKQVCIFGSTSTNYTPPLSDKAICVESTEPCHPCFKRTCKFDTYACLKELTPDMVLEKIKLLLSEEIKSQTV